MSQSLQGGQGTVISLSQPILQSARLPSREEMPCIHPREHPERTPSSRLQLSNPNPPLSHSNIST
ncbi:hypothetical protein P692DRAFT_20359152 [Suillus brevipes Sb2]|nr:hypothetical protein P692DRAFT_20359152 [Suillus brevipes Sb2]